VSAGVERPAAAGSHSTESTLTMREASSRRTGDREGEVDEHSPVAGEST